jgi:hypothetical protein
MKRALALAAALAAMPLSGCLEVNQHPPWKNGYYAGKPDAQPQGAHFKSDVLAWNAAIENRNRRQDEYERVS